MRKRQRHRGAIAGPALLTQQTKRRLRARAGEARKSPRMAQEGPERLQTPGEAQRGLRRAQGNPRRPREDPEKTWEAPGSPGEPKRGPIPTWRWCLGGRPTATCQFSPTQASQTSKLTKITSAQTEANPHLVLVFGLAPKTTKCQFSPTQASQTSKIRKTISTL